MSNSNLKNPTAGEQRIVFTGRGNNEDEAEKSAILRYNNWQHIQTQAEVVVNELSREFKHKKHNDVHYKCELFVNYISININPERNKKSIFRHISKYLRTINPKLFYSRNNLNKKPKL